MSDTKSATPVISTQGLAIPMGGLYSGLIHPLDWMVGLRAPEKMVPEEAGPMSRPLFESAYPGSAQEYKSNSRSIRLVDHHGPPMTLLDMFTVCGIPVSDKSSDAERKSSQAIMRAILGTESKTAITYWDMAVSAGIEARVVSHLKASAVLPKLAKVCSCASCDPEAILRALPFNSLTTFSLMHAFDIPVPIAFHVVRPFMTYKSCLDFTSDWSRRLLDASNPKHTSMHFTKLSTKGDAIVLAIAFNERRKSSFLALTGRTFGQESRHYSTADAYSAIWKWKPDYGPRKLGILQPGSVMYTPVDASKLAKIAILSCPDQIAKDASAKVEQCTDNSNADADVKAS